MPLSCMGGKHPPVKRLLNFDWARAPELSYCVPGNRLVQMAVSFLYSPECPTTVSWPSL